ncbi:MAG: cytochrome C, partial [Marivirga sp.]|nr:cytochrome C [Marivirga sp.]
MNENPLIKIASFVNVCVLVCIIFCGGSLFVLLQSPARDNVNKGAQQPVIPLASKQIKEDVLWSPPDSTRIPSTPEGDLILYGHELVAHTAAYLGPKGKVISISNGMNCQNCHLRAGKKPFGNSYAGVASTYPKYRARSGTIETIEKRVNDCIERSLNGKKLDENSTEMKALVAYIKWVGSEVTKGVYPKGAGLIDLPVLARAADPLKGALVYNKHCSLCHGEEGQGVRAENTNEWKYPPLYDENSYNTGA